MKKMIIPILILLLLTGYTPYVEVNDLVIVDMIGLEKVNDKYLLTVNTIKEEKTDNATKSIYQVSTFEGNSLGSIFLKAKKINNKKAYYGHLKLVVFQSGLLDKEIINYFQKQFTQMNYLIVGTNSDIKSLFKKYDSSSKIIKEINKKRIQVEKGKNKTVVLKLREIKNKVIPVKKSDIDNINIEINCLYYLKAPIEKGDVIGNLKITLNEEVVEVVDIVNNEEIKKKDRKDYFLEFLKSTY